MQNMTQVELEVRMKEEHNGVLSYSDDYCEVTDSLSINVNYKNLQHIKETDNSVLLKKEGDGFLTNSELEHSKVVNHVIKDTESGGRDSPNGNDLEVLNNQLGTRGSKKLTSDEQERDKVLNGPEFQCVMASNSCANRDEPKLPDNGAQIITSEADSNLYTDKSVMECEHVKDICIDKGEPLEEKGLIDKHTDNFVGPHVSRPSSQCGSNETTENHYNELQEDFSDLTLDRSEANVGNKIEKYGLVEETLVTTALPLEKFGTRSFLRSFMDSLNSQGDEDSQQSNQNMKPDPKNSEAELKSDPEPSVAHVVQHAYMDEREQEYAPDSKFRNSYNPFFDSENVSADEDRSTIDAHHETPLKNKEEGNYVEVQSAIVEVSTEENLPATLINHDKENFNPFMGKDTENVYQVSAESPTGRSTNNPFTDCEDANVDMNKNYKSAGTNPFTGSEIHASSDANSIQNSDQQPELNHKSSSLNPFTSSEVEGTVLDKTSGNKLTVVVPEQQYLELRHLLNHEGASKNASSTDHGEAGLGETSFAAVSGRITYSGPIAVSGSTSLRSDSSTTSTRSFAFPVLQSEWNSSPVRMERADRRKQRGGWKHGILCCKF